MKATRIVLPCLILLGAALPLSAATSTWLGGVDSDFSNAANWSAGVPTDIAQFGASAQNFISSGSGATFNTLSLLAGAPAYQIDGNNLQIVGTGIQNASANPLTLSGVTFGGFASAGTGSIIVDSFGRLMFNQRSTAGSANIQNNHDIDFFGNASAGVATITNSASSYMDFNDSTSLGNATIVNHGLLYINTGVNLGVPTITTDGSSGITHFGSSRGGGLTTFTNSNGGILSFESVSAGQATIANNSGGQTIFISGASAGNATITNNGGLTAFYDTSTGGTAALFNIGASTLDITGISLSSITIGSISGTGAVLISSHTLAVGGNGLSTSFSGIISGTNGSLLKTGVGTLTLGGANTYTGGTTIVGGTLRINDDTNLGAAGTAISFDNRSILDVGPGVTSARSIQLVGAGTIATGIGSSVLSGRISGPGGLTVNGSGLLTLTGQNNYTGGTTIDGATLRLGAPGSLPDASAVTLTNTTGSTLDMGGFDLRLAGLTGNGGQVILGTATLTLTGNLAYDYFGTFAGTGKIVLNTLTTVYLSSVPASVTTEVQTGALVSFSLGDVHVSTSGYLFVNDGNIAMQNCVNRGQMIIGDLFGRSANAASYSGDGLLIYENGFFNSSTFTVTGQANLSGGKFAFWKQGPTTAVFTDYTVIQAGSVVGRFAVEPASSIFEEFQTIYSSSEVHVLVTMPGYSYAHFAGTRNQMAVARALDTSSKNFLFNNGLVLSQIAFGAATVSDVQHEYDMFGGDALASFQDIGLRHAASFMDVIRDRSDVSAAAAASTSPMSTDRIWAQGVGSFDRTKANADIGSPASQATTNGFQAGYDLLAGEQWRLGLSGGYLESNLSVDERQFSGDIESVESGLYASYVHPRWFLDGAVAYIGSRNHGSRELDLTDITPGNIVASNFIATPISNFNSRTVSAMVEGGARFRPQSVISLEPKGFLRWSRLRQDNFVETNSQDQFQGTVLIVDPHSVDSLISSLGVRAVCKLGERRAHPLELAASADWQHELGSTVNEITARFDNTGPSFAVQATPRFRNAAVLGADARLAITRTLQAFFQYQFTTGDSQQSHALTGGLRLQW